MTGKKLLSVGLFWEDLPEEKRQPSERTWERPDYLPDLAEALVFNPPGFAEGELFKAYLAREPFVFDCEVYPNFFFVAFKSLVSGKVATFEFSAGECFDVDEVRWCMENLLLVGFNCIPFDVPMVTLACHGLTTTKLKLAADKLIQERVRAFMVLRAFKARKIQGNVIDLIQVCPLRCSLKIYSGRLHAQKMQDLPFPPDTVLSDDQKAIVRHYCVGSDLANTELIWKELKGQLTLREKIGEQYGIDLRSKSDAQVAEAIIASEIQRRTFSKPGVPKIEPGTVYHFQTPDFVKFKTTQLREVLCMIEHADFIVGPKGSVLSPPQMAETKITMGFTTYQMGIGGLHSTEKRQALYSDENYAIFDRDVASYYPAIIINNDLFPKHIGRAFLDVYTSLRDRRVAAKNAGDNITADALKISVNGIFGKTGNKYSVVYSPDLVIQTTITGQLALLMLIEDLEVNGIHVASANTDGFVTYCPRERVEDFKAIVSAWERQTKFTTEETEYDALFSRDVNNYIAIKPDGKTKTKGAYANPWSDPKAAIFRFHKNPTATVAVDAVLSFLTTSKPVEEFIRECRDIQKFVVVRAVKGGAVKDAQYLGKAVRWYYADGYSGEIVYAKNGNKVPSSEGAKPCLVLPSEFPGDVDFERYIALANDILKQIAYFEEEPELEGLTIEESSEEEEELQDSCLTLFW